MRFQKLDLNLLVVLDALLSEQSVSVAAERVNLQHPVHSRGCATTLRMTCCR